VSDVRALGGSGTIADADADADDVVDVAIMRTKK
jgi:hypothetical protein